MQGQGTEPRPYPLTRLDGRSVQREDCALPLRSDLYQTVLLEWEKRERSHAPSYECCSRPEDRQDRPRLYRGEQREREQGHGEYS